MHIEWVPNDEKAVNIVDLLPGKTFICPYGNKNVYLRINRDQFWAVELATGCLCFWRASINKDYKVIPVNAKVVVG
jgi:hypothetical protein